VLYEMHVGTFTAEGTYTAAAAWLPALAEVGINVVELMPVNEFAGRFGWGYDGVDLWAPTHLYGTPDDLRRFVDTAHASGVAVLLDVVYNHLGPDGGYLKKFTHHYFTSKYENEWGEPLNFDGPHCRGVREFFIENAAHWIDEYHFDGLRIDATQSMFDSSSPHVLAEIVTAARAASSGRQLLLVAENEPQDRPILTEHGFDAMWNDDWHHAARVAATGRAEAYYGDYRGTPQELISMARHGFLYQGQRYAWQKKRRGTPSRDLEPQRFVCYLDNHDQVANSARGERIHMLTSPARLRAMTALLLLQPQTPLLFQGQEFAASASFTYFADHEGELAERVATGRHDFLRQFPSLADVDIPLPHARETFESCRLDQSERERNAWAVALHRDLLRLRGEEPFASQRNDILEGSVLGAHALALRWFAGGDADRLLIVNLGADLVLEPAPDPLLAPPLALGGWKLLWSSEDPAYRGTGTTEPEDEHGVWRIAAESAVVMKPRR
jgi:maltooligosyltrehalose trehalohydrolase